MEEAQPGAIPSQDPSAQKLPLQPRTGTDEGTGTDKEGGSLEYQEPNQVIDFTNEESSPDVSNTDNIT